jgi:phage terminase large subunit
VVTGHGNNPIENMNRVEAKISVLAFGRSALRFEFYDWQAKALCHIAAAHPTAIVAANGAGKTSTIFTCAALWCLYSWPDARIIVTSAGWDQLKKQFFASLHRFRNHPAFKGWNFLESEVRSAGLGYINGISVDNAGRAEGYHQREGSPVMILADECKSIADDVFTAFAKCTATFRVYGSAAGPASGAFYHCLTTQRNFWACIKATSFDCPHISRESIEMDREKDGEHSPQFRQKHLAEFTDAHEESFISVEAIRQLLDNPPEFQDGGESTFIDWSTGGDETVIARRRGNKVELNSMFRERDPVQVVRRVAAVFRENDIRNNIYADAGGIGGPMSGQLMEFGFYVSRIHNGSPAQEAKQFANLAAEQWFAFRRMIEKREIILPEDGELVKQLSARRLQYDSGARIQLEPKETMKARGLSSPDRADAVIGACADMLSGGGAITAETIKGIRFGGVGFGMFPSTPITFGDSDE